MAALMDMTRLLDLYDDLVNTAEGELPKQSLLDVLEIEATSWTSRWCCDARKYLSLFGNGRPVANA